MEQDSAPIQDREAALEALESYEPATTKRALRFLVDQKDFQALPRILPLTQHPDPAIRFVAKRAARELQALPPEQRRAPVRRAAEPTELHPSAPEPQALPRAANGPDTQSLLSMDPRLQTLLEAPVRRRPRRPRSGGVPMRWFDLEL